MTTDAVLGQIVFSKAGRDKGRAFLVIAAADDNHVLVADGTLRKLARPKKKKLMHLRFTNVCAEGVAETLRGGLPLLDADIRKALAAVPTAGEEQEG